MIQLKIVMKSVEVMQKLRSITRSVATSSFVRPEKCHTLYHTTHEVVLPPTENLDLQQSGAWGEGPVAQQHRCIFLDPHGSSMIKYPKETNPLWHGSNGKMPAQKYKG